MNIRFPKLSRRNFLRASLATGAGAGLYTWQIEPHWAAVTKRVLHLPHLPAGLAGKCVVHLSDLHLGPVRESYLVARLQQVAALAPWMVDVTGDFLTAKYDVPPAAAAKLLKHLQPDKTPVFAVFGNHDYGPRWRDYSLADDLATELQSIGVRVLRNERVEVAGLQLFGCDDLWAGRCDVATAVRDCDREQPVLALLHNPDGLDEPGWDDFRGWILSGHTHGGQVRPPFLPPPIIPVRNRRYSSGVIDLADGRQVYISRGLGYTTQLRFNVRPEIGVFELQAAALE